ncbi:MAG: hypothetical protein M3024_10950 [Candidatus Dormibacteraeota bacterium]|nr:hypothetical protein [Candidatus Dormibacteraeota bacterium]
MTIDYWNPSTVSPSELVAEGHDLVNTNSNYLYHLLGAVRPDAQTMYDDFEANMFAGGATSTPTNRTSWASYSRSGRTNPAQRPKQRPGNATLASSALLPRWSGIDSASAPFTPNFEQLATDAGRERPAGP